MQRTKLGSISLIGLLCATASAQPPSRTAAVVGKPYSADERTESAKGVVSTARVFRDGQGRVRREVTVPGLAGAKARTSITISDYVAKVRYDLNPVTKTAVRSVLAASDPGQDGRREGEGHAAGHVEPPHGFEGDGREGQRHEGERREGGGAGEGEHREDRGADKGASQRGGRKHEDLGTRTVQGVSARGSRNTVTLQGGPVSDESWFSPDVGVEVKAVHRDPQTGQTTRTLGNIKRGEPSATLFQVPTDYKLK